MKVSQSVGFWNQVSWCLLPERNRETVFGDLIEERDLKTSEVGEHRARVWFLWQVLSFVPVHLTEMFSNWPMLVSLCAFTALCGAWLGLMGLRFRHPGYIGHECISATIIAQGLLTLLALFTSNRVLKRLAMVGALSILWLGARAWFFIVRGADFEGYIVIIATLLLVQTALTWLRLSRDRSTPKQA